MPPACTRSGCWTCCCGAHPRATRSPFPPRAGWFRPVRALATAGAPREDGGSGLGSVAGSVRVALAPCPLPSSLLHPVTPGCPPPLLLPRRGRRDHVGLGGGGESGPPAQASGVGGRHHWQGQCRPPPAAPASLRRRGASNPFPGLSPLLLRWKQPAAASSLWRCRCRYTRRRDAGWLLPFRSRVCGAGA